MRLFADVSVRLDKRPDGSMLFTSTTALPALDRCVGEWLERWADEDPSRPFLMERDPAGPGWRALTFGEARDRVHAIATWLLGQNVSTDRPIVVLSGNSPRHALLSLAAMHIGVPICPVSTGWSLLAEDHRKLKEALTLLTPGLLYVEDLDQAMDYLCDRGVTVLGDPTSSRGPSEGQRWVYFLAPWGMQFELVSYPHGKAFDRKPGSRPQKQS